MGLTDQTVRGCIETAHALLRQHDLLHNLPVDVMALARRLGFQVVQMQAISRELSGLVSPKHRLIGINGTHHPHRQRFTVAHELGHISLHHPPERRCTAQEIDQFNREADTFASEILIPTQLLLSHLRAFRSVHTLAKLFDVSEEAMRLKIEHVSRHPLVTK
jgi:Zn-dependent peptidase ImmA (M78 family)